jgi:hypothetical protein
VAVDLKSHKFWVVFRFAEREGENFGYLSPLHGCITVVVRENVGGDSRTVADRNGGARRLALERGDKIKLIFFYIRFL